MKTDCGYCDKDAKYFKADYLDGAKVFIPVCEEHREKVYNEA